MYSGCSQPLLNEGFWWVWKSV